MNLNNHFKLLNYYTIFPCDILGRKMSKITTKLITVLNRRESLRTAIKRLL